MGDVVITKIDNKNRATWPLAVVTGIYPGEDGIVHTEHWSIELNTFTPWS